MGAFIYVKIPSANTSPIELRGYDAGLDDALLAHKLGTVIGWGDSMSEENPRGHRELVFHRIDIEVEDVEHARPLLRQALSTLGAPAGSELHYSLGAARHQDVLADTGWRLAQPLPD